MLSRAQMVPALLLSVDFSARPEAALSYRRRNLELLISQGCGHPPHRITQIVPVEWLHIDGFILVLPVPLDFCLERPAGFPTAAHSSRQVVVDQSSAIHPRATDLATGKDHPFHFSISSFHCTPHHHNSSLLQSHASPCTQLVLDNLNLQYVLSFSG
ncbi:hypothetical protein B0H66DRAFT_368137 [Apodospora peruviana]|uniref:Uncharacterized protein n=1 Tax=Apodospora peruviana TaxID=516989 RepID=A0AAE0M0S4_9PEZI|nr:hypothetical protein B0H66DRAFT_368137 [Apodospora peruviana]